MLIGITAPILTMVIALGVEVSGWTVTKQRLQRAADMAAIAGAEVYNATAAGQSAANYAAYVAELNSGAGGATHPLPWNAVTKTLTDNSITVTITSGVKNANDVAVQVTVQTTVGAMFTGYVWPGGTKTISATAMAELVASSTGRSCVLTLDSSNATGVSTAGIDATAGATLNATGCGFHDNSKGVDAFVITGGATVNAANVAVASSTAPCGMSGPGSYTCSGNGSTGTLNISASSTINASAGVNPYASVPIPATGTCAASHAFAGSTTISAGTFCGGLSISYGTLTMNPGVYIVNGGTFAPAGGATVNGTGVTIVLTGSGSNYATANIANGVTLNLTAPTTGSTAGIAILQDPSAPSGVTNTIAGGANMIVTGAMVFPTQIVSFSNGASNTASCTQLIAYQLQFSGGATFNNNCSGKGTSPIDPTITVGLVQ